MLKQTFTRQTYIKADLDHVWKFFSNPHNLPRITPRDMRFRIIDDNIGAIIQEGMHIRYKVRPMLGIPMIWETEITAIEPGHFFVDTQRKGPYALWEHTHVFELHKDGVLMTDHVEYRLPAGSTGRRMMGRVVERRLNEIFDFRARQISSIFATTDYAVSH